MQGSTVEAMSAAVEDAAVVVYGISIAYKESVNCRLEAQYAMQQEKEMLPLLLEEGYKPSGWLGMLLGVRLWYGFYGKALSTEAAFETKVTELCRELDTKLDRCSQQPQPLPPPLHVASVSSSLSGTSSLPHIVDAADEHRSRGADKQRGERAAEGVPPLPPSPSLAAASPQLQLSPSPRAAVEGSSDPAAQMTVKTTAAQHAPESNGSSEVVGLWQAELREANEKVARLCEENQLLRESLQLQLGTAIERLTAAELASLELRLQRLYVAQLVTVEEAEALQDAVADFVADPRALDCYCAPGLVHTMARLSSAFSSDVEFARQLRRKCWSVRK